MKDMPFPPATHFSSLYKRLKRINRIIEEKYNMCNKKDKFIGSGEEDG
jgi:hypothetical protein